MTQKMTVADAAQIPLPASSGAAPTTPNTTPASEFIVPATGTVRERLLFLNIAFPTQTAAAPCGPASRPGGALW